ncbi:MAG: prepilin-type N-terminal cleavage/methylation domain-containing protein [Thermostichales cyanobacterium HHBFW_bins_127]
MGSSRQDGFTLVEVLAALAIVSIALAALAPSVAVAVLSRLQSQRIEVATQLAIGELDRFRTAMDMGSEPLDNRTPMPTPDPAATPATFQTPIPSLNGPGFRAYPLPASRLPNNAIPPTPHPSQVRSGPEPFLSRVNPPGVGFANGVLGDPTAKCFPWTSPDNAPCDPFERVEYVVQIFRDPGRNCCVASSVRPEVNNQRVSFCEGTSPEVRRQQINDSIPLPASPLQSGGDELLRPCLFTMTVRVYHRTAFSPNGIPNPGLGIEPIRPFAIGGQVVGQGPMTQNPLVVMSAEMGRAGSLFQFLGATPTPSTPSPTP